MSLLRLTARFAEVSGLSVGSSRGRSSLSARSVEPRSRKRTITSEDALSPRRTITSDDLSAAGTIKL